MPVQHNQISGVKTPGYTSGVYYTTPFCHNFITQSLSANSVYYSPIAIGSRVGILSLAARVSTASAGSAVRLGIYNNNNCRPGSLILDAGTIDSTTTGVKEITLGSTLYLNPGWYWFTHFSSGAATLDSMNGSLLTGLIGNSVVATSQVTGLRATLAYSALPATAYLGSLLYISSCPLMWFKTA